MFAPSSPISFSIELTYSCNQHCSGCANVWTNERHQQLKAWRTLLDKIAPPDNRKKYAELIRITGGEPTLHSEFFEIIEYLDTFDIPYAIFTTGRWKKPAALKIYRNAIILLVC